MATQKEIRAAQAAYLREWRKKNPEKNRMYCESYWNRRIERMKADKSDHRSRKTEKRFDTRRTNVLHVSLFF